MRKKNIIIQLYCIIVILFLPKLCFSWEKIYGGWGEDLGLNVQQTSDGGYIIVGQIGSYAGGPGNWDVYLIKTDGVGNKIWEKIIGGSDADHGSCVRQTSDGYIIVGYTYSFGATNGNVYLIKTDSSGNKIWEKNFNGVSDHSLGISIEITSDNCYIIAGYREEIPPKRAGFLMKIDSNGNKIWERTYSKPGFDSIYTRSVKEMPGGYIILGTLFTVGVGNDVYLIKTDSNGNTNWAKTFGGIGNDEGREIQVVSDGYIIIGQNGSVGSSYDVYLIKADFNGNIQWERTYGGASDEFGYSVKKTLDGGYIISGSTYSYGAGLADVYIIKTDSMGTVSWSKVFGGSSYDCGSSILQAADGSYIVAGSKNTGMYYDVYLNKFDNSSPTPVNSQFESIIVNSINQITWTSISGTDPCLVEYRFDGSFDTGWQSSRIYIKNGLSANTIYSQRVRMRDTSSNYCDFSAYSYRYTLSPIPNLLCNKIENFWYTNSNFTFTNKNIYGIGGVNYYRYVWTQESNYNFIGFETAWNSTNLNLTANVDGQWYLHIVSYNQEHATNIHKRYGPYLYDGSAPITGSIYQVSLNTNTGNILWTAQLGYDPNGIQYEFVGSFSSDWQVTNLFSISNLTLNTKYSQRVRMKDGLGNIGPWGPYRYKYTLPAMPLLNSDKSSGIVHRWPLKEDFVFTNKNVFGRGGVEFYRYKWVQSDKYTFIGNEEKWGQGTLTLNGHSAKSPTWYLHIQSYNGGNEPGDKTVLGPFGSYNIMQEMKLANYPNPFNPNKEKTTIEWYLENDNKIKIVIYSVNGEIVKTWDYASGQQGGQAGSNRIEWDGRNNNGHAVGNGIYFCYMYYGSDKQMIKMAVVK